MINNADHIKTLFFTVTNFDSASAVVLALFSWYVPIITSTSTISIIAIASIIVILTCPGNYVRQELEVTDYFKDINSFDYFEEFDTIDKEYVEQFLSYFKKIGYIE